MSTVPGSRTQRLAWPVAVASLMLVVIASAIGRIAGGKIGNDVGLAILTIIDVGALGSMGALIASRTGNLVGWVLLGIVLSYALYTVADTYAAVAVPRGLPLGGFAGTTGWPPFVALALFPAIFLLFPTGHLPSRRWRPIGLAYTVALLVLVAGYVVQPSTQKFGGVPVSNPLGIDAISGVVNVVLGSAGFVILICALASFVALVVRYRGSGAQERQQIRWLLYVGAIAALATVGAVVTGSITDSDPARWEHSWLKIVGTVCFYGFVASLMLGIPIACVIAILKYRLYELDRVVRRTAILAILAVAITGVYVAIVSLAGTLVHGNVAPLVAASVVAVVFQPLRDRTRRLADRLVYGDRATPYEVLASFTDRVGERYAADDVLPRMVQVLASATGAESASVWIRIGATLRVEATWPDAPRPRVLALPADQLPEFESEDAVEVRDKGEFLGAITVKMPPGDPMTPAKERLVQDLAAQAGLVLRNVQLIEELRESRRRIVTSQDERARKLERDIHDGAQQQLVALTVKLRLARQLANRDLGKAEEMLDQLQGDTTDALENLRDLARGIYPPLLADEGLMTALEAQARKAALAVTVEGGTIGRFGQDIEAAVYFSCLEALQNIAKYADASHAMGRLSGGDGALTFAVTDDGLGFDPSVTGYGTGLQGMADRLASLGGVLEVSSTPGSGTTVTGRLPVGVTA